MINYVHCWLLTMTYVLCRLRGPSGKIVYHYLCSLPPTPSHTTNHNNNNNNSNNNSNISHSNNNHNHNIDHVAIRSNNDQTAHTHRRATSGEDSNKLNNITATNNNNSSNPSNNMNMLSDTMLFIRTKLAKEKIKQQASDLFSHKTNPGDKLHAAKQGLALRRKVKIAAGKSSVETRYGKNNLTVYYFIIFFIIIISFPQ